MPKQGWREQSRSAKISKTRKTLFPWPGHEVFLLGCRKKCFAEARETVEKPSKKITVKKITVFQSYVEKLPKTYILKTIKKCKKILGYSKVFHDGSSEGVLLKNFDCRRSTTLFCTSPVKISCAWSVLNSNRSLRYGVLNECKSVTSLRKVSFTTGCQYTGIFLVPCTNFASSLFSGWLCKVIILLIKCLDISVGKVQHGKGLIHICIRYTSC